MESYGGSDPPWATLALNLQDKLRRANYTLAEKEAEISQIKINHKRQEAIFSKINEDLLLQITDKETRFNRQKMEKDKVEKQFQEASIMNEQQNRSLKNKLHNALLQSQQRRHDREKYRTERDDALRQSTDFQKSLTSEVKRNASLEIKIIQSINQSKPSLLKENEEKINQLEKKNSHLQGVNEAVRAREDNLRRELTDLKKRLASRKEAIDVLETKNRNLIKDMKKRTEERNKKKKLSQWKSKKLQEKI